MVVASEEGDDTKIAGNVQQTNGGRDYVSHY
jgi:hypothetical protein